MNQKPRQAFSAISNLALLMQMLSSVACAQYYSHVTVNTPARSYSHGVGDPISVAGRRSSLRWNSFTGYNRPRSTFAGYPRVRPSRPFISEDVFFNHNRLPTAPLYKGYEESSLAVLPPSPYKVDSADPESLWPEGLFIAPPNQQFRYSHQSDAEVLSASEPLDPYLLEGSEAIAAVAKAKKHGIYYFHDIPHINSLFANQELRIKNNLKPHRIASIRLTWPFNRP